MWSVSGYKILNPYLRVELPLSDGDKILADGTLVMLDEPRVTQRRKPKKTITYPGYNGPDYIVEPQHHW